MKRGILALTLSAGVLFLAAAKADAQVIQGSYINPWNGTYGTTTYNPYTGGVVQQSYGYNPYYGSNYYSSSFSNPYTGNYGYSNYGYNGFNNTYQYNTWRGNTGYYGGYAPRATYIGGRRWR